MKRREVFATGLLGAIGIGSSRALAQAQANVRFLTPETDPSQVRVWQELISRYAEANRGVTIRPEYASWDDLIRKIPADLIAGTPPEIVAGSSRTSFMAAAAKRNLLVDLAPIVDQLGRADFHGPSLKAWQFNGIQAAIPYGDAVARAVVPHGPVRRGRAGAAEDLGRLPRGGGKADEPRTRHVRRLLPGRPDLEHADPGDHHDLERRRPPLRRQAQPHPRHARGAAGDDVLRGDVPLLAARHRPVRASARLPPHTRPASRPPPSTGAACCRTCTSRRRT